MSRITDDPVERCITDALDRFGFPYKRNVMHANGHEIDFLVTFPGELGPVYIECKQFSTPRTSGQIAGIDNIIVIQGMQAAKLFQGLINCLGILRSLGH